MEYPMHLKTILFTLLLLCFAGTTLGQSNQPLADSSMVYVKKIQDSEIPVLIDFWAEWCGPCRMLNPTIQKLKKEYDGKVKVIKVNVDRNPQLSAHFQVRSIPVVYLIKNNEAVERVLGLNDIQAYKQIIEKHLPKENKG